MTEKCKLNDLAKDLGVSNKELIDLIEARFGEQKKADSSAGGSGAQLCDGALLQEGRSKEL